MLFRFAASAFGLATLHICDAHIVLQNPVPYGNSTLNNSPLQSSGLDFPCKLRAGVYELTQMNYWIAGEAQTVSFLGSATHGGGSCQFSVTEDLQPTKASKWKVLHSVVGGCPASVDGNLPENSAGQGLATFNVTLPSSIPNGNYTFAWTWFNRAGDREMYMNCAPISVSSNESDTDLLDTLPDMFLANLPSTTCSTVENFDYAFPDPGDSVETGSKAKIATVVSNPECASVTRPGTASRNTHSVEDLAYSFPDGSGVKTKSNKKPTISTISIQPKYTADASGDVVLGDVSTIISQTLVAHATSMLAQGNAMPHAVYSAAPTPSSGACILCHLNNRIVCIGESHFGICNLGCALPQPLAAGTLCSEGQILRRGSGISAIYGQ